MYYCQELQIEAYSRPPARVDRLPLRIVAQGLDDGLDEGGVACAAFEAVARPSAASPRTTGAPAPSTARFSRDRFSGRS
jgi:hypothetical protein